MQIEANNQKPKITRESAKASEKIQNWDRNVNVFRVTSS